MRWVFNLFALAALPLLGRCDEESLGADAVTKVVKLLEEMKTQLVSEREADDDLFQEASCFCQEKQMKLTEAIDNGGGSQGQLVAAIDEGEAKSQMLTESLKQAKAEKAANEDSLQTQTTLNSKETAENLAERKTTVEAISALAIALEKLQPDKNQKVNLAQVRAAASRLQEARIMSLTVLGGHETVALKAFLRHAEDPKPSFLQATGPFKSYGSQTGQIIGILTQMKDDFEKHLADLISEAKKSKSEFESFSAAKEAEISSNGEQVSKLTTDLANAKSKLVKDNEQLRTTLLKLDGDRTELVDSKKSCATASADYEKRTTDRLEEMKAIEETIQILNSDETFKLRKKTLPTATGFLQIAASTSVSQSQQKKRHQAALLLQRAAVKTEAPWLALMASKMFESPFALVVKNMEAMIQELGKQQEDEVANLASCKEDLLSNANDLASVERSKENLAAEMDSKNQQAKTLEMKIKEVQKEQTDLEMMMKAASKHFEESEAEFKQIQLDQTIMIDILTKATRKMQDVYEPNTGEIIEVGLLQRKQSEETDSEDAGGKQGFQEYKSNPGGSRVIAMLKTISHSAEAALNEAVVQQREEAREFKLLEQRSDEEFERALKELHELKASKADLDQDIARMKADFSASKATLENLAEAKSNLHEECDFLIKAFDTRQAARSKEIEALKEAQTLLTPAKGN